MSHGLFCFYEFMPTLVTSTKACAKLCICWSVCVGFLKIGWFPNLILHPTLVIFILLCRTNWDQYLNVKCFVTICAKLFIGVSHINALHNWPTSRLFHTPFPQGCFHSLPALFLLFLAFLDNQKEVEPSRLAESWNCPLSPPTFCLGFCYSASFFFPIIFGSGARLYSYNLLILMSAVFPFWLKVNWRLTLISPMKPNPATLISMEFCSVVDLQKQCKGVCMCIVVVGGGKAGGRTGIKPLFLKVMETSHLGNINVLMPF